MVATRFRHVEVGATAVQRRIGTVSNKINTAWYGAATSQSRQATASNAGGPLHVAEIRVWSGQDRGERDAQLKRVV